MLTPRLEVRLPVEADRFRFVELFCDPEFMVFSGVLAAEAAHARFDRMLARAAELPFAKQPVIVRATGVIVGYVGVDCCEFEGNQVLEFGWRLVPEVRGRGYATEAGQAVLAETRHTFAGEILAFIDPGNHPSSNVARKLGVRYWKRAVVDGFLDDIYQLDVRARVADLPAR